MPMLFYLPLIIWMGMCEVMREEMREPADAAPPVETESMQ